MTGIHYSPSGKDKIVHNHRTSDEYSIEGNVVSPYGFFDEIPDKDVLERLLGTQDVEQINNVSQWFNDTDSSLWRLNKKPNKKDERVLRFDADSDRLILSCDWYPSGRFPAFRVIKG